MDCIRSDSIRLIISNYDISELISILDINTQLYHTLSSTPGIIISSILGLCGWKRRSSCV